MYPESEFAEPTPAGLKPAERESVGRVLLQSFNRWHGIVLCSAALVSTVWLALTNQLVLYIHPRYVVFTVIMAVLALGLVIASFARRPAPDDHDHENNDPTSHPTSHQTGRRVLSVIATGLTVAVSLALIVVPPATLTAATADQRVINSTAVSAGTKSVNSAATAPSGASVKFSVLDWSSLLRQSTDAAFYSNKPVDVVGFITKDPDDPTNMFYLSRFVITCCAVDAQPVGVPVYLANWATSFKKDEWVRVTGVFNTNPSSRSQQAIALAPTETKRVSQPGDPYLY